MRIISLCKTLNVSFSPVIKSKTQKNSIVCFVTALSIYLKNNVVEIINIQRVSRTAPIALFPIPLVGMIIYGRKWILS